MFKTLQKTFVLFFAVLVCVGFSQPGSASAKKGGEGNGGGNNKVLVCHATGSETNPYVLIAISRQGWENGHKDHQDDRDFLVSSASSCPTKEKPHQDNDDDITKVIPPQVAGVSTGPGISSVKQLPQGGAGKSLISRLWTGLVSLFS